MIFFFCKMEYLNISGLNFKYFVLKVVDIIDFVLKWMFYEIRGLGVI